MLSVAAEQRRLTGGDDLARLFKGSGANAPPNKQSSSNLPNTAKSQIRQIQLIATR
jgi:hypothetical protein